MAAGETLQAKIQQEIGELSQSITGLVSAFRKLREPLTESHEKVPQATNQLDKISEQTEAAAHRMLDTVENLTWRQEEVMQLLNSIKERSDEAGRDDIGQLATKALAHAETNLNDTYNILDALQFQDITSQQMDHAASLLNDIEQKLHGILQVVGVRPAEITITPTKKERAYDPHADMYDKKTNQADIDSMFAGKHK